MSAQYGQQTPGSTAGQFNAWTFFVQRMLAKIRTVDLVQVVSCSNSGGVTAVGTVAVQVLVNQMTGNRVGVPHSTIYNLPYFRIQGGANAVIIDPNQGDIGLAAFCARDISAVKKAKAPANPGSYRLFDWADGLYLGGFLNGVPTQYVQFNSGGMSLVSPTSITLQAPTVTITASSGVTVTSPTAAFSASVTAGTNFTSNGIDLVHHGHTGVTTGGGITGGPTG